MKPRSAFVVRGALLAGCLFLLVIALAIPALVQTVNADPGSMAGDLASARVSANLNVTHEKGAQSGASIAVDPTNSLHILISVNDFTSTAAVYESVDGGKKYTKSPFRPTGTCDSTWMAFNAHGDAFFSYEIGRAHV